MFYLFLCPLQICSSFLAKELKSGLWITYFDSKMFMLVYLQGINEDLKNMATFWEMQSFPYFIFFFFFFASEVVYRYIFICFHTSTAGHRASTFLAPPLENSFGRVLNSMMQGK